MSLFPGTCWFFCSSHKATRAGHTAFQGKPHKWFHSSVRGIFIFPAAVLLEGGLHCPPRRRSPRGAVSLSRMESQFLPSLAVCSVPRSEGSCSPAGVQAWAAENWTFSGRENMENREFYREMVDDMCMG